MREGCLVPWAEGWLWWALGWVDGLLEARWGRTAWMRGLWCGLSLLGGEDDSRGECLEEEGEGCEVKGRLGEGL